VKSEKVRQRRSFGPTARTNARVLGVSTGEKRGAGKWPKKGENTMKGLMVSAITLSGFSMANIVHYSKIYSVNK